MKKIVSTFCKKIRSKLTKTEPNGVTFRRKAVTPLQMSLLHRIKNNPGLKKFLLYLLMPKNQARPRWWVSLVVNPFIHKKGKGALIRRRTRMDVLPFNKFSIGANSTIEDFSVVNNGMGEVKIGFGSRIGMSNTIIGPVTVGNNVILAQNVVISALNHGYEDIHTPIRLQPCKTAIVTIGDDSWVGANAVITSGVTLGKHVVVAAGSVVTKDVPDYSIVAGNPARILKQYNSNTNRWEKPEQSPTPLKLAI
jgi:acetyltransferase-like isoleucine patch superfamily enzyme